MLSSYQCEYYFMLLAITMCLCSVHLLNEGNFATVLTSSSLQIIFNEGRPVESESVSSLCLIKSVMGARVEYWEGKERGQCHKKWQVSLKVVSYTTLIILSHFGAFFLPEKLFMNRNGDFILQQNHPIWG